MPRMTTLLTFVLIIAASASGTLAVGPWGGIAANQIRPVEEGMFAAPQYDSPAAPLPTSSSAAEYVTRVRRWEAALLGRWAPLSPYARTDHNSSQLLEELVADLHNISNAVQQHVWPDRHKQRQQLRQQQQPPGAVGQAAVASATGDAIRPQPPSQQGSSHQAASPAGQAAAGSGHTPVVTGLPASSSSSSPIAGQAATSPLARLPSGAAAGGGQVVSAGVMQWQEASRAAFLLAVLSAAAVLPEELVARSNAHQLDWLHTAARAGSIEAQLALADRAFTGRGEAPDCMRGLHYLKAAAASLAAKVEQEGRFQHPGHVSHLRERWMNQELATTDWWDWVGDGPEVVEYEADAALSGDLRALRTMGYRRLVGRGVDVDPAAALQDFTAAARLGDPYAFFNLGYMLLRGIHVKPNATMAVQYFKQAAAQDLAAGHNGLGVLAFLGQGMERNLTAARLHFKAGAAHGSTDSMYNLGGMYMEGLGVSRNVTEAMLWYDKAYSQGHWRAPYSLALLYDPAAPALYPSCAVAERLLWQFVAERSEWSEQLRMAQAQEGMGRGWPVLLRYLMLAEQGCEVAQANAAFMLLRGSGGGGRHALHLAAQLLMRSSLLNATDSMVQLAQLLHDHPWLQADLGAVPAAALPPPPAATQRSAAPSPAAAPGFPKELAPLLALKHAPRGSSSSSSSSSIPAWWPPVAGEQMDPFRRTTPALAYDPMYGGSTPYTHGYSFGWRSASNSSSNGLKDSSSSSSSHGMHPLLVEGSAPFPRPGYGHAAHTPAAEDDPYYGDYRYEDEYEDDEYEDDFGDDHQGHAQHSGQPAPTSRRDSSSASSDDSVAGTSGSRAQLAGAAHHTLQLRLGGDPASKAADATHSSGAVATSSSSTGSSSSSRAATHEQQQQQPLVRPPGVRSDVLWLQQAADMGDAEAVLALTWRYVTGDGVPQDLGVARDLLAWGLRVELTTQRRLALQLARGALRALSWVDALFGPRTTEMLVGAFDAAHQLLVGSDTMADEALEAPSAHQQLLQQLRRQLRRVRAEARLERLRGHHEPAVNDDAVGGDAAAAGGMPGAGQGDAGQLAPGSSSGSSDGGVAARNRWQQQEQGYLSQPSLDKQQQQQQQGSSESRGAGSLGQHLRAALGMDKVDPDNLAITVLLGMLAGVLWLRQRQLQEPRYPPRRQPSSDHDSHQQQPQQQHPHQLHRQQQQQQQEGAGG